MDSGDSVSRWVAMAEVTIFYVLVHFVIWGGRRPAAVVIVLLLLGICISSNYFHRDSLEKIGLAGKNFFPNLRWTIITCAPLVAILWLFAWPRRYEGLWELQYSLLGYPIWAFVQEYVLLGFLANRLEEAVKDHESLVPWINGFLFGMAHLPNPALMCVTYVSGVLFTWIFLKHRHLIPATIVHALFGAGLSIAFGWINGIMSVGPGYYTRLGTLPY